MVYGPNTKIQDVLTYGHIYRMFNSNLFRGETVHPKPVFKVRCIIYDNCAITLLGVFGKEYYEFGRALPALLPGWKFANEQDLSAPGRPCSKIIWAPPEEFARHREEVKAARLPSTQKHTEVR